MIVLAETITTTDRAFHDIKRRIVNDARAAFGTLWDEDPELRALVRAKAAGYASTLRNLRSAQRREVRRAHYARNQALKSFDSRLCALITAAAQKGKTLAPSEAAAIATELNAWHDCGEPIGVHLEPKHSGGFRHTAVFGIKRTALSYLCRDVLLAIWGPPSLDYNSKGRGSHAAIRAVKHGIEHGDDWLVVADIKNCFPSIRQEGLATYLPLPESVIRNSILIPGSAKIDLPSHIKDGVSVRDSLRQGLPQGAPASSLIAARVIEDALAPIAFDTNAGCYADNFWATCWSKEQAESFVSALSTALKAHPVGELTLHDVAVQHSDAGVQLLGYRIRSIKGAERFIAWACPRPRSFTRHWRNLAATLKDCKTTALDDIAISRTTDWMRCWSEWSPGEMTIDRVIGQSLRIAAKERHKRQTGSVSIASFAAVSPVDLSPPW